jgi:hypothetical protein
MSVAITLFIVVYARFHLLGLVGFHHERPHTTSALDYQATSRNEVMIVSQHSSLIARMSETQSTDECERRGTLIQSIQQRFCVV